MSVMLLRCSRQGLLKRKRGGRSFFYRLSNSGRSRLEYVRHTKNSARDMIKLPRVYAWAALKEILTSSDSTLESFSDFLTWLYYSFDVPIQEIGELGLQYLLSTRILNQPQLTQPVNLNQDLLNLDACKCLSESIEAEDFVSTQLITKEPVDEKSLKPIFGNMIENQKLLNEVIKKQFGINNVKKPTSEPKNSFRRKLLKAEPSTSQPTATKRFPAMHEKVSSYHSAIPPSALRPVIRELISKAKEVKVVARHKDIPKDVIAELEKASKRGVPVTVLTDNVAYIRTKTREEWVVEEKSNISFPLFMRVCDGDIYEVLTVFSASEPHLKFGVRTFVVEAETACKD